MKHTQEYFVNLFCSCILLVCCIFFASCKKMVQVPPPPNQLVSNTAFADDASATSAITGIYSEMMGNSNQFCSGQTTVLAGLAADELSFVGTGFQQEFETNDITQTNHGVISSYFWDRPYKYIYTANLCIEGLNSSTGLTPSVKQTLLGEAKFIRAFCYFYLINFFGDVPLITTTGYSQNASLPRSPVQDVYGLIISDLQEAQSLLPATYVSPEKLRPNKWAATALLARVYLYKKDWAAAEREATLVIASNAYALIANLNNVFLKGSAETVWQLYPVNTVWNTWEARNILPSSASAAPQYRLSPSLLNAFQASDNRRSAWVTSKTIPAGTFIYPFKYKVYGNNAPQTEYYVVLRLAEQYLVRAEARAQQNNISGALADLNTLRARAGLPPAAANDQPSLLAAIEAERRIELMFEWGNRWFDLKRTGRVNTVISALKPSTWQPTDSLWPIPIGQLATNPFLTQNPGY
jgi:starch-binding outer membrane protein, SusD/RagB family